MRQSLIACLGSLLLTCCGQPETKDLTATEKNKAENTIATVNSADADALKSLRESMRIPSQIFKLSSSKPVKLTGKKGTVLHVVPGDLITESGEPIGPSLQLELKELTNQEELLRENAQTVSDGRLLVSAGAYYIGFTSEGQKVTLKKGKTLTVQFPKSTGKKMALFYGQRNREGQMNWQETGKKLIPASPDKTKEPIKIVTTRKSSEDELLEYMEGTGEFVPTEKKVELEKNKRISQELYKEMPLSQFGWINCDQFLKEENSIEVMLPLLQDSLPRPEAFFVFKNMNTVLSSSYYKGSFPVFSRLPIGHKASIIAFTVYHGKIFASVSDVTISKNSEFKLDLKEKTKKEFSKLVNTFN